MLLEQWKVGDPPRLDTDLKGDATVLGIREKQLILRQIARKMITGSNCPANIVSAAELESTIAKSIEGIVRANPLSVARVFVKQLREQNGILRLNQTGHFSFVYPAFLEYFCAEDLRHRFYSEKVIDELYLKKLFSEWVRKGHGWNEVICFFCGMVEPLLAIRLLDHIFKLGVKSNERSSMVFFVVECLKESKNKEITGSRLFAQIRKALMDISNNSNPKRTYKGYAAQPARRIDACRAVEFLGSIFGGDDIVARQLKYIILSGHDHWVRLHAVKALPRPMCNGGNYGNSKQHSTFDRRQFRSISSAVQGRGA